MTEPTGVRAALLAAAYDEVVAGSWARARMADVASRAGVSRQTLYNEFGSKDALAQALSAKRTEELLAGVDLQFAAARTRDPIAVLGEAVGWVLDQAHGDPLVKAVLVSGHDAGALLPLLTTEAEPILEWGSAHIFAFLIEHWPSLPERRLRDLSDSLIRLIVSHVVLCTEPTETTAGVIANLASLVLGTPANKGV